MLSENLLYYFILNHNVHMCILKDEDGKSKCMFLSFVTWNLLVYFFLFSFSINITFYLKSLAVESDCMNSNPPGTNCVTSGKLLYITMRQFSLL